jgi:asparagine synthase (glutamine-hydrolysing)
MSDQFTCLELSLDDGIVQLSGTPHARFGHSVTDEDGVECGISGGWIWNNDSLVVESDLHGYLPLYFHHSSKRIIISDSPLTILSRLDRRELDPVALGFFCRAGFLIGDRTLFQGIHRVPAGARMSWKAGDLDIEISPSEIQAPPKTIKEAVDGWIDRFQVAMKRRLPGEEAFDLPLSGGRDSRMIMLELQRHGHLPRRVLSLGSAQFGKPSDITLASLLSQRLGVPFVGVQEHDVDWLNAERKRHVACGFEALEHVWLMPLWNELLDGGVSWYDGLGAGSLTRNSTSSPEMTALFRQGDISAWSEGFFALTAATSPRWLDLILEQVPFTIADTGAVLSDLKVELEHHLDAPNPITSFTFENWGRRSIALNPLGICRSRRTIELPFMDRDLVSWARSIPVEMMHKNDIQTEACHRLYPDFSDIPFDDGSPPKKSKASLWLRYRRKRQKTMFFRDKERYFGTLPFKALANTSDKTGSHRALVLMFHLASVDSLVTGE